MGPVPQIEAGVSWELDIPAPVTSLLPGQLSRHPQKLQLPWVYGQQKVPIGSWLL